MSDLNFINGGSIVLLIPQSDAGKEWVRDHVEVPDYASERSVPVEPRYVKNIIDGAQADGLEVELS